MRQTPAEGGRLRKIPLVLFAFIGCHPRAAPEGRYRPQFLETTERFLDGSTPPTSLWQLELTRAQVISMSSEASLAACESALSGGRHSCVLNLPPCLQVTVSYARGVPYQLFFYPEKCATAAQPPPSWYASGGEFEDPFLWIPL